MCQYLKSPLPKTSIRKIKSTPTIEFNTWKAGMLSVASSISLSEEICTSLMMRYGIYIKHIFNLIKNNPFLAKPISPELPFIYAEINYCIEHEFVIHLEDLLRRRIPIIILDRYHPQRLHDCAHHANTLLKWDAEKLDQEIQHCKNLWKKASLLS